jgi:glycosyltransferase involved in cell wall biosynthesis
VSGGRLKRMIARAKYNPVLRRMLLPLFSRFPTLRRRLAALFAQRERDIAHPDWPAPLPAAYLHLPLPHRKVLLDLARAARAPALAPAASALARLAWVAPHLPDAAGTHLLAELARRYDIDLIVTSNAGNAVTDHGLPVRSGVWFEQHHARFAHVLYHVANSVSHGPVLDLLARHPGIVALHDFSLGAAVSGMAVDLPSALYHAHGYSALLAWRSTGDAAALGAFPLNRIVFDQATGIIVAPAAADAVRTRARAWFGPRAAADLHLADLRVDAYAAAIEYIAAHGATARYRQSVLDLVASGIQADPRNRSLIRAATALAARQPASAPRQLLVDISAVVDDDLKTGIQRVVRSILLALIKDPPAGFRVEPVYGTSRQRRYRYARRYTLDLLGCDAGSITAPDDPIAYQAGDMFLGLDLSAHSTVNNLDMFDDMRKLGMTVYFVVYDMLPIRQPHAFPFGTSRSYGEYMLAVACHADGLVCISRAVADEVCDWVGQHGAGRAMPLKIGYFHLGADLDASAPSSGMPDDAQHVLAALAARPSILMVGTLEPRKAHAQALAAFDLLWQNGVDVNLVIVGKEGWSVDALATALRTHPQRGKKMFWLPGVSDQMLTEVYRLSSALLAASLGEGFGLPLIEAAQHGLPIIARDLPVFREVSGDHAFYFDGAAPASLAEAVKQWLDLFRQGQAPTSADMPWLTWSGSAQQLLDVIVHDRWYRKPF